MNGFSWIDGWGGDVLVPTFVVPRPRKLASGIRQPVSPITDHPFALRTSHFAPVFAITSIATGLR